MRLLLSGLEAAADVTMGGGCFLRGGFRVGLPGSGRSSEGEGRDQETLGDVAWRRLDRMARDSSTGGRMALAVGIACSSPASSKLVSEALE